MSRWLQLLTAALIAGTPLVGGCAPAVERVDAPLEEPAKDLDRFQQSQSLAGAPRAKAAPRAAAAPEGPPAGAAAEVTRADASPDASAGLYIIRKGRVTVEVTDVRAAMRRVADLVKEAGGFVADSSYAAAEGAAPSASLTLRVPSKRFDALLDAVGGVGKVFARSIGSEDVTLSYVDTESRVRNLRQEQDLLRKMLDRAGKLSDVLMVERELARVSGEIERAQGRLRHLANQVELATLHVTLSEKVETVTASPWGALPAAVQNAISASQRTLARSVADALEAGIWFGMVLLPTLTLLGGAFLLVGWGLRRWLVGHARVPATWYDRAWGAVGVTLVLVAVPSLMGAFTTLLLVLLALAAGTRVWTWLQGRRAGVGEAPAVGPTPAPPGTPPPAP